METLTGTVLRSQKSSYVAYGFAEKDEQGKIAFFILSSKHPHFGQLEEEWVEKIHDFYKNVKAYKEERDTMGVYSLYLTDDNFDFLDKHGIIPKDETWDNAE